MPRSSSRFIDYQRALDGGMAREQYLDLVRKSGIEVGVMGVRASGSVKWQAVFSLLMDKGFEGYIIYEAPNPAQWNRPPEEVAREGIAATRDLIARASARSSKQPD